MPGKSAKNKEVIENHRVALTPAQFKAILRSKGWSYRSLAEWWDVSLVWINKVANSMNRAPHFDDALIGLPDKRLIQSALAKRQRLADVAISKISKVTIAHSGGLRYRNFYVVGAVVSATEDIWSIASFGMKGVVFDVRIKGKREEYGVIFENGGYDWFSPDLVDDWLSETGIIIESMKNYAYKTENELMGYFKNEISGQLSLSSQLTNFSA